VKPPSKVVRVLIVKTSSLGDLVHTLSAVEEALRHRPDIKIDWVCEEGLVDIPRLIPKIDRVIPLAIRRWRCNLFKRSTWREIYQFIQKIREHSYDCVIDAQGLMKTMWVVTASNSRRQNCWGYSLSNIKEPLASLVCGRHVHSPVTDHSIERLRQLFAAALSYAADGPTLGFEQPLVVEHSGEILFLHGTSRPEKLWPTHHWISLGKQMTQIGYTIVIPAGSELEAKRAKALASAIDPDVIVLEQISVADLSNRIRRAAGVVGVDSGLMHLAVALNRPTVAIMTADHQLKFLAKRFAPFWASHAAVVIPHQVGADITPSMVFSAWQGLDQQPKIKRRLV